MSASPVSSPDTLSAEMVAEMREYARIHAPEKRKGWFYRVCIELCDSHGRLRALLSERPTLSQADAERDAHALIKAYTDTVYRWVQHGREMPQDTREYAALRAALLGEKP